MHQQGVAFKVTYNDGTLGGQEWFSGVCSPETIRHNIEAGRSQCMRTTDPRECHHWLKKQNYKLNATGGWCYESEVFKEPRVQYACGNWHNGSRAHQTIQPTDITSRGIAFLTTRIPGDRNEGDRRIFAVYRIGDGQDGVFDSTGDGRGWMVRAAPGLELRLPRDIAFRTTFWPYYAPDKKPDWRMGLYRYLDEDATDRLMYALHRLLQRTAGAEKLAAIRGHSLPLLALTPPRLAAVASIVSPSTPVGVPTGRVRVPHKIAMPELSRRDPELVERGLRGHAETLNECIDLLTSAKISPRKPRSGEPNYDLAWEHKGSIHVAEIKSLTRTNEETQLRLGLGQVLRYRHQLANIHEREVSAVLVAEQEPSDPGWIQLCRSLGVRLMWPGALNLPYG